NQCCIQAESHGERVGVPVTGIGDDGVNRFSVDIGLRYEAATIAWNWVGSLAALHTLAATTT
ncbi:MAG: hypothetical protein ACXWH0_08490, partial [Acidimicrobiia bacterium]